MVEEITSIYSSPSLSLRILAVHDYIQWMTNESLDV